MYSHRRASPLSVRVLALLDDGSCIALMSYNKAARWAALSWWQGSSRVAADMY